MTEAEAIRLATAVMRDKSFAKMADLNRPEAQFFDKAKEEREFKEKWPNMDHGSFKTSWWLISFPLFEEDEFQRTCLSVSVDDPSGVAKYMED